MYDVAIVGAGISGLVCAEILAAVSLNVVVLESRSRIGGRLMSTPTGVDLGGSWTWEGDKAVAALAKKLGLELVEQNLDGDAFVNQGRGVQSMGNAGGRIAPVTKKTAAVVPPA